MRIGGEAPGRRVHSAQRLRSHGFTSDHRPPRIVIGRPRHRPAKLVVVSSLPFHVVAYEAGRNDALRHFARRDETPKSDEQLSCQRHIVLRVLPRPSAVRA
jgi:hypothetical protein